MSNDPPPADRDDGWGTAFAFWGTLLVAGALFASVSLAPKLKTLAGLRAEYAANQLRLVELERRADELERVAEALEHDPSFAAELAKVEFAAARPGDERIAVPEALRLGAAEEAHRDGLRPPSPGAWSIPPMLLDPLATHRGLRIMLLTAAAGLASAAFLVLNERHAATLRTAAGRAAEAARRATDRYRKC
ncbi:MAG TPA: hypothetical protein VF170_12545 [Planctomycetaceae bacterium]